MRFEQPWWFLAALPALAAAAGGLFLLDDRRARLVFPGTVFLKGALSGAKRRAVSSAPWALKTAAVVLVIAAMARPQTVTRQAAGLSEGIDILLTLDTSTSMRAMDFDPLNRMEAAKNAARDFIRRRVSDRIGILVFGGDPLLSCPLTLDYDALQEYLSEIQPGMTLTDGTAIGDGIASSVNHLKDQVSKSKVIILLTDGRSNSGLFSPITAAKTARSYGIKIYTIGTAERGPALYPVDHPVMGRTMVRIPDELDEDVLIQVAAETGGKYYRASNLKRLNEIYAEIDALEKHSFERPETVSYRDLHPMLLIPAALLLALELLLSSTALLRIP